MFELGPAGPAAWSKLMVYLFVWPAIIFGIFFSSSWAVQKVTRLDKKSSYLLTVLLYAAIAIYSAITSDYPYNLAR